MAVIWYNLDKPFYTPTSTTRAEIQEDKRGHLRVRFTMDNGNVFVVPLRDMQIFDGFVADLCDELEKKGLM